MRMPHEVDALVVGAGFSGLYSMHKLRGLGLSTVILEKGDGVGGTWYWNRYPGARCDVESPYYSYSFDEDLQQDWEWTERYPAQPELLKYINHVADRFDLRKDIFFETTVVSAVFDESTERWTVTSIGPDGGSVISAKYCIMATGCLSSARMPDIPGINSFTGRLLHTGMWPHEEVDFTGQRVGVIGTGSSGIQAIPMIAKQAKNLQVFQRTANFSVPAFNGPIDQEWFAKIKANYPELRERSRHTAMGIPYQRRNQAAVDISEDERRAVFEEHWPKGGFRISSCFNDLMRNKESNDSLSDFVRAKIEQTVTDPKTAELLKPYGYPITGKRICVDTDYYATFNRENVQLIDVKSDPIVEITPTGVRTESNFYELDALVVATGFDAMTGAMLRMDIRGRDGASLREHWDAGARTYLGVAIAGFPNLFTIAGPGSPSVLSNMLTSIEQHVEWITDHLAYLQAKGYETSEATTASEAGWVEHVRELADQTLFPTANSWYLGANVPGKPRVFMPYVGGVGTYRAHCEGVAAREYEGFALK
ncbi:cyclohexanone monooxygenase [Glutamicibacter soli]|uniref:Cyclohexanone monooxygenase n=2 Tax=Glutamicibacter soli TaxID=453836 RepID=A0A365YH32_9MICC|nr:cyclohexanone monooxygenase [Glutamicibacter soli]